jgi:hypothetical protein
MAYKRREVNKSNRKETQKFNMENPPQHEREKPQVLTSKNFTMIEVRLQTPTAAAYKK